MPATLMKAPSITAICLTFNPRDWLSKNKWELHCRQKYYTKYQTQIVPTFDKSKPANVKTPLMRTRFRRTVGHSFCNLWYQKYSDIKRQLSIVESNHMTVKKQQQTDLCIFLGLTVHHNCLKSLTILSTSSGSWDICPVLCVFMTLCSCPTPPSRGPPPALFPKFPGRRGVQGYTQTHSFFSCTGGNVTATSISVGKQPPPVKPGVPFISALVLDTWLFAPH